jgi:isopentenyl phosphate kinase
MQKGQYKDIILIKLGGSFITDKNKPYTAKNNNISLALSQLKDCLNKFSEKIFILGNGAGSYGHYAVIENDLQQKKTLQQAALGISKVHLAVNKLNALIVETATQNNTPLFPLQPSAIFYTKNGFIQKNAIINIIIGLLEKKIIPSIYGDIVYDKEKPFHILSTEDIFHILIEDIAKIENYKVEKTIYITQVDGVYDSKNCIISQINRQNFADIKKNISQTNGFDVTGGMLQKIEKALVLAESNIKSYIGNINMKNTLERIINEENISGTWITK